MAGARESRPELEVDGGVKLENCRDIAQAGASILVAGSAIFGNADPRAAVNELRETASSQPEHATDPLRTIGHRAKPRADRGDRSADIRYPSGKSLPHLRGGSCPSAWIPDGRFDRRRRSARLLSRRCSGRTAGRRGGAGDQPAPRLDRLADRCHPRLAPRRPLLVPSPGGIWLRTAWPGRTAPPFIPTWTERASITSSPRRHQRLRGVFRLSGTDLAALLARRGIRRAFVCGLATDYCVKATALDARRAGLDVVVIADAIRGVEVTPGDCVKAIDEMRASAIVLAPSADLTPPH